MVWTKFIFILFEVLNMVNVLHYSLMECDVQSGRQVLLQKNLLLFFCRIDGRDDNAQSGRYQWSKEPAAPIYREE
jgi:hypothetical protein